MAIAKAPAGPRDDNPLEILFGNIFFLGGYQNSWHYEFWVAGPLPAYDMALTNFIKSETPRG